MRENRKAGGATSSRRGRGSDNGPQPSFGHGHDAELSPPRRRTGGDARGDARPDLPRSAERLPALDDAFWLTIDSGLALLGLEASAGARAATDAHARLLIAWNEHINLTALRDPQQIARGHVLDSLAAVPLLRRLAAASAGRRGSRGLRILDLGSGGGYPGLPVAVMLPVERCALVDSVRKKAAFLQVAAQAAQRAIELAGEQPPSIDAIAERAEDLADDPLHRQGWDVVLARAVGSVAEVVELALPLLALGGHAIAWKRDAGRGSLAREVAAAERVVQAAGGSRPRVVAADESGRLGEPDRRLVLVRKVRPTPDRYPRPPAERRRQALLP